MSYLVSVPIRNTISSESVCAVKGGRLWTEYYFNGKGRINWGWRTQTYSTGTIYLTAEDLKAITSMLEQRMIEDRRYFTRIESVGINIDNFVTDLLSPPDYEPSDEQVHLFNATKRIQKIAYSLVNPMTNECRCTSTFLFGHQCATDAYRRAIPQFLQEREDKPHPTHKGFFRSLLDSIISQ